MAATVAMGELRRKREAMDRLVDEIATNEDANQDSITMSIRDALERGWSNTFIDALEDAKKKKDVAIERICSKHYLQLLRAVQEVHDLKAASASLKAAGELVLPTLNTILTLFLSITTYYSNYQRTSCSRSWKPRAVICWHYAANSSSTHRQVHTSVVMVIYLLTLDPNNRSQLTLTPTNPWGTLSLSLPGPGPKC